MEHSFAPERLANCRGRIESAARTAAADRLLAESAAVAGESVQHLTSGPASLLEQVQHPNRLRPLADSLRKLDALAERLDERRHCVSRPAPPATRWPGSPPRQAAERRSRGLRQPAERGGTRPAAGGGTRPAPQAARR